jgi:hypothetical protein
MVLLWLVFFVLCWVRPIIHLKDIGFLTVYGICASPSYCNNRLGNGRYGMMPTLIDQAWYITFSLYARCKSDLPSKQ